MAVENRMDLVGDLSIMVLIMPPWFLLVLLLSELSFWGRADSPCFGFLGRLMRWLFASDCCSVVGLLSDSDDTRTIFSDVYSGATSMKDEHKCKVLNNVIQKSHVV